jgi:type IV secretion system protein VirB5
MIGKKKGRQAEAMAEASVKGGGTAASNNPYLNAREEWLERYGNYISRAAQWRMAAFIALVIACLSVAGNIIQMKQEKITRYFVAVNELGKVAAARMDGPASQTPARVIQAEIAAVIENWRTVTVDTELQKRMIGSLTAHTAGAAKGVLKQWYDQNNPFEIAKGGKLINVQIHGLPLPVSQGSYRVEWTEIVRNHQGIELSRDNFEAIATVEIMPPQDEATMLKNPGGVYISNLSAGKIIK